MWDRVRAEVVLGQEMVAPPWLIRELVNLMLLWTHNLQNIVPWKGWRLLSAVANHVICPWIQPLPESCGQGRGACDREGFSPSLPSPFLFPQGWEPSF